MTRKIINDPNAISLDKQTMRQVYDRLVEKGMMKEAAVMQQKGMDRRTFLKLLGSSLALSGVVLSGCVSTSPPDGEIIPYVEVPEEIIPGKPLFFATSVVMGGLATGVLLETYEGRPTRIEGNPKHPASLGAVDVMQQASILELYSPDRSIDVRTQSEIRTWEEFLTAFGDADVLANGGAGLRILTETVTSPTLADQLNKLLEEYPEAKWYQYEPVSQDNLIAGSELAFGEAVNTVYDFTKANVVISIDGDFLNNLRYARDFMSRRKVRGENTTMNRLYAIENTHTNLGAVADHRLAMRPSDAEGFVHALAIALGVENVAEPVSRPWSAVWFNAVVADLEGNRGSSLVVAGMGQSPEVHALIHAINAQLENVGETVIYAPSVQANPVIQSQQITELVTEMRDGDVEALFILGGNPVYNAPVDVGFGDALAQVPFSVHLSLYDDETSQVASWHIPQTHFIEEWSDARAFDGTVSVVQPPIGPLYPHVRSNHEIVALIAGDDRRGYDILREFWQADYSGDDFDRFWRKTLHDGVMDNTPDPIQPTLVGNIGEVVGLMPQLAGGLEIVFRPDPAIWDGRFANNSWLQEIPHPISKISWDTAAYMSRSTLDERGLSDGDLVELLYENNVVEMPVWAMPGHADNTITVTLGYGRGISGEVDEGRSFNAYLIRTSGSPYIGGGAQVSSTGETYNIVTIRGEMEIKDVEDVEPIHSGTLQEYLQDPKSVHGKESKTISLLAPFEYDSYAWGMAIDLTSCIGCNSCMVACQGENNIPTVGKEGVSQQREMHWIRVDRYHVEEEGELQTHFQPVPCMQCENAPCEQVCPVHATVHGDEGLNQMVYNRCIGTRYCSANCPYSVRRFNFFDYVNDAPIMEEWRNPNVSVRVEGVMEKCTYCVHRIKAGRINASTEGRELLDSDVQPACASACPTQAIIFGDINNPDSEVTKVKSEELDYGLLAKLNTQPRTTYLASLSNPNEALRRSEME